MNHERQTSEIRRDKALKLALLFGWAGAHRFYTKQTISGLAYLVFCWTLVPGLLSLIDAAFLARMSDDDFLEEFCESPEFAGALPIAQKKTQQPHSHDLTA